MLRALSGGLLALALAGAGEVEAAPVSQPSAPGSQPSAAPAGNAGPAPTAALLTMGVGDELYARFGHAALLIRQPDGEQRVYNYGYADFTDPALVWSFLRGRAPFWVASSTLASTLRTYRRSDRSVYIQPLHLSPEQARELAQALEHDVQPEHRAFIYHHFEDNCATRLRDLLDRVTGGRLARVGRGHAGPPQSLRGLVRRGFSPDVELLLAVDLVLGRRVDRRLDLWDAAFLPEELARLVKRARMEDGAPLAGKRRLLYSRKGPPVLQELQARAGIKWLWNTAGLALVLGAILLLLILAGSRFAGLVLLLLALPCGLLGLGLWSIVALATLPELRLNELVLCFWPLDLGLCWVAGRWLRGRLWAGGLVRWYLGLRFVVLVAVGLGQVAGLLVQRPLAGFLLSAGVVFAAALACGALPRRRDHRAPAGSVRGGGNEHGDQASGTAGAL